jgi:transcriptional regulator with XRE-family HTH domain
LTLKAFGARLEAVRRRYGKETNRPRLNMADFAHELGISAARYRRYERGEVEPTTGLLGEIRRRTNASLDWLICDMSPGKDVAIEDAKQSTVGQRLRWVREFWEPDVRIFAGVMRTETLLWLRYERDELPLPFDVGREVAHRLAVSLDYLFEGRMTGVAPSVEEHLVERYPQLLAEATQRATQAAYRSNHRHSTGAYNSAPDTPARRSRRRTSRPAECD